MNDGVRKFERFRQEQARLHDPLLVSGTVELVPTELSEAAAAAKGGKRKKKRHGTRAGWEAASITAPDVAEPLLPSGFMRKLRTRGEVTNVAAHGQPPAESRRGEPHIEVEPEGVARRLGLFQEQAFTIDAPDAQQVELVWYEERELVSHKLSASPDGSPGERARARAVRRSDVQRVVMDHREADRFETKIGIADGAYLFAFAIDGYTRPDASSARRVLVGGEGVFAPLTLARQEQRLMLANKGKAAECVRLEAAAPWLVPEQTRIELPARGSVETTVRFDLSAMSEGLNEGLLHLSAEREEGESMVGIVHFAVQVEVGGAVPEISFTPREFGEVKQGLDELQLWVEVTARGRGLLTGMINLPYAGELVDFRLSADEGGARFAHTFRINSADLPPPHRAEAALKVVLITDSFLANFRLYRAEVPYRLIHLKKSLPALSFGTMRAGSTKALRLEVERSDKQDIELGVAMPDVAATYLEAYPVREDAFVFRFDPKTLPPGTNVSETVELIDLKSGLRDQIKILATVEGVVDEPTRASTTSTTS